MLDEHDDANWIHSAGVTFYFSAAETGLDIIYEIGDTLDEEIDAAQAGEHIGSGYMFGTGMRDISYFGDPTKLLDIARKVFGQFEESLPPASYLMIYDGQSNDGQKILLEAFMKTLS